MAQAQHSVSQTEGEQGAADAVMIGPGLRPAEDEFKAQILTLQVVSIDLAMSNAAWIADNVLLGLMTCHCCEHDHFTCRCMALLSEHK